MTDELRRILRATTVSVFFVATLFVTIILVLYVIFGG